MIGRFSISALLLALSFGAATAQEATTPNPVIGETVRWDVCNETSYVQRLATAYVRSGKMQVTGWTRTNPGACSEFVTPRGSARFLYSESDKLHRGGVREWRGKVELCVEDDDFTSDATENCKLANKGSRRFFAVKPTERITTLIEPGDFGVNAQIAGIQRLLQDAGYRITRVDGQSGRRTSRTIRDFKKKYEMAADIDNTVLLAKLIEITEVETQAIGLKVCNTSSADIWAAIGIRQNGNWSSRGWWEIAPLDCLRPYTRDLDGTEAHLFALQTPPPEDGEDAPDRRLRTNPGSTPAQFCIAEARFAALGRDMCTEGGYSVASFRPIPTDSPGHRIELSDSDFMVPNMSGLR